MKIWTRTASARVWLLCALASVRCTGAQECTELGCSDEAIVTYPAALVSGAYDLIIVTEGAMTSGRCNDPTAPETADNPPGLTCDSAGYTLTDDPAASARSARVTIIDTASGDPLVEDVEVILNAVGEEQPNGAGCPPTCFTRTGRLLL